MFERLSQKLSARSTALLVTIDRRLHRIVQAWLLLAGLAAAARIAFSSHRVPVASSSTGASYLLVVLAPVISTLLALRWFADGDRQPQPRTRLARLGRWRDVTVFEASRDPLYGAGGIMASLLVGIMLNVPVRAAEYFVSMPPLPLGSPPWLAALHFALTLDVVLFGSLYMVAFVAALRRVPLFPRLLAAIWIGDLAMQLITANLVAHAGRVPPEVATALLRVLDGNVKKVLISVAVWLPYLLLSKRVNITYRHRIPD
jgi:hypothetical protein